MFKVRKIEEKYEHMAFRHKLIEIFSVFNSVYCKKYIIHNNYSTQVTSFKIRLKIFNILFI